jgi:hypothetical protein
MTISGRLTLLQQGLVDLAPLLHPMITRKTSIYGSLMLMNTRFGRQKYVLPSQLI